MLRGTLAMVLILGTMAIAAASASAVVRTITPAATAFTGALIAGNSVSFTTGSTSIVCTASTLSGTTKSPAATTATVSGPSGVTFTGCNPFLGGMDVGSATVVTGDTWTLEVANDTATCDAADNPKVCAAVITVGFLSVTFTTILGSCTITAKEASIDFSLFNLLRQLKLIKGSVPFTTDGGAVCPASPATIGGANYQLNPASLSIT
jgi:hypothetical protein